MERNNKERILDFLYCTAILMIAFGDVYSIVWEIFTRAAWIPVACLLVSVAATIPTIVWLVRKTKMLAPKERI